MQYADTACIPVPIPVKMREPVALAAGHGSLMRLLLRPAHRQAGKGVAQTPKAWPWNQAAPFLHATTKPMSPAPILALRSGSSQVTSMALSLTAG